MSIDARIAGVSFGSQFDVHLTLEKRDKYTPAGQQRLHVLNPPEPWQRLTVLIGCCIWGDSSHIMLGDYHIADRQGYTAISLRDNWEAIAKRGYFRKSKNSVRDVNEAGEFE